MSPKKKKIAIIGGGITGLTLAYRLTQQKKFDIQLYERSQFTGGLIQTEIKGDFIFEKGPDGFLQLNPSVVNLAKELGIDDQIITTQEQNRKSMILHNNKLEEIPDGFYLMSPTKVVSFLQSPLISLTGKIRTLLEPLIPKKSADSDDESLASFVRRRFGKENLDNITQALLGGIYTADPELLSMKAALPRFLEIEQTEGSVLLGLRKQLQNTKTSGARYGLFGSFRNGMSTLTQALTSKLDSQDIHTRTSVSQMEYDAEEKQWRLTFEDESVQEFDMVCLATAPHHIVSIFPGLTPTLKKLFESIPYASTGILNLAFRKEQIKNLPSAMGFIVPQKEQKHFIACSFMSQKYANRTPKDHILIRAFIGGSLQELVLNTFKGDLVRTVIDELRTILGIEGEPTEHDFTVWRQVMPQYTVGHTERVAQIEREISQYPNLYLAGNAYRGVGIPDLIDHATQLSQKIV
jgi:oxygen-dependent protoporphyrinogen oxidase